MTTLMFLKRFLQPILSGHKHQTIRPPRKRPLKIGETLSLRHWEDKAYRSPQVEFAAVRCAGAFAITVDATGVKLGGIPVEDVHAFARGDGFGNWNEMREFFESRFGYGLPFEGTLIQWEDAK